MAKGEKTGKRGAAPGAKGRYGKPKHSGQWRAPKGSKCAKCSKPAAVKLAYAGSTLCQSHFTKMFESRVKRAVRQFHLLQKGDKVAVGLSGGKDSVVTLHMLHKISKLLPFTLVAISVDEGIGDYRSASIECAKRECAKLGVPLLQASYQAEYGKTLDRLLEEKGSARSCAFCGVMRRRLINKIARNEGCTKVAVGHNADDVAQTVLMNFMRNEPERLARFGPIAGALKDEGFVPRIRPLFNTPR